MSDNKKVSWLSKAFSMLGKKETDRDFNNAMTKKWYDLFKIRLPSIMGSANAWCGLFVAAALYGAGVTYKIDGYRAKNWDTFGAPIEWRINGIPSGAIVRLNHGLNCDSSKGNHVAFASGDCTADELKKSGATISLLGGNQSDRVKISNYSVKEICAVRWPKDAELPGKVTQSINCSNGKADSESTR